MTKYAGFAGGGYGIVFCQGEHEVGGRPTPAMLIVMINNESEYIIGKAIGGEFTDFGWWKPTGHLNRGPGASNTIAVDYDEEGKEFRLEINGQEVERFSDREHPALSKGRNGYIAVITPLDRFPEPGVGAEFQERE